MHILNSWASYEELAIHLQPSQAIVTFKGGCQSAALHKRMTFMLWEWAGAHMRTLVERCHQSNMETTHTVSQQYLKPYTLWNFKFKQKWRHINMHYTITCKLSNIHAYWHLLHLFVVMQWKVGGHYVHLCSIKCVLKTALRIWQGRSIREITWSVHLG